MAAKEKIPVTPAVRALRQAGVAFTPYLYRWEEMRKPAEAARALGLSPHHLVKTIVLEDERGRALIVLQHVDRDISTQALARRLGVKQIEPCTPERVTRLTGYLVGGTSPFGTRTALPVYLERSAAELPEIYVNGGKRGFLVGIAPAELIRVLHPELIEVAVEKRPGTE